MLVNAKKRAVHPVVRELTQLSDALARYLALLGLKRRRPMPTLQDYLAERGGKVEVEDQEAAEGDQESHPA